MRPGRLIAAVTLTAAVAVSGCSARATVDPSARSAQAPAGALQPAPTTTAATSGVVAAATASSGQATAGRPRWTTGDKAGSNHPRVPADVPMLVAIRTGRHGGYDRVVVQFDHALPSWRIGYVTQMTDDARGAPVALAGRAFLRLVANPAWDHDQTRPPYPPTYTGPGVVTPRHPTLVQVRYLGEWEGYLTFGLGLSHRAGFRVQELHQPSRLVIDVAH